jgi:DNA-binding beta-propeller fold protein YncE
MKPRALTTITLALLLLGLSAALPRAGGKPVAAPVPAPVVWPSAPSEARVTGEGCFSAPADLGIKPSMGKRFLNLVTGGTRGMGRLAKPCGVAVDEDGNLCVTDTGTSCVNYFDFKRHRFASWERIDKVHFVCPVAVAKADGIFYVADSGLGQVVAFDGDGHLRFRLATQFTRPVGVAVSGGKLYVADSAAHRVLVFDLKGRPLGGFGSRGAGPGEFNFPSHVNTDSEGRIYVTDAMNSRIQLFDGDGHCLGTIGSIGDGSGHFSRPKGVAVDSFGHLYVADALFDNIQIFDRNGSFLLDVGSRGSAPGEFWMPAGVAISRDNRIYIADTCNARVQILRYIGKP